MNRYRYRVVVTDDRHHAYDKERLILEPIDVELVVANCTTAEEVRQAVMNADGVLCNMAPMPADVIRSLDRCRIISRYGVGYENVDAIAAEQRGIYVANVPDYCVEDVSDHALALLLACARKVVRLDRSVRMGKWNIASGEQIGRLQGKTFGLIGFGLIARAMLRKLKGFDCKEILVYDPFVDARKMEQAGARKVDLPDLCSCADFISIHAPLNAQTRGMIGKAELQLMKPTAILVNVARGPVIDEAALIHALQTAKIHMAGLDVFETEPPRPDNPLLKLDNVVLSDHAGYFSIEAFAELKTKAAKNIFEVLSGRKPIYPVNNPIQPRGKTDS